MDTVDPNYQRLGKYMTQKGIIIESIADNSPAEKMGLEAGDVCLQINGHGVQDFLDFQFYQDDVKVNIMLIQKADGTLWEAEFELDEGEILGVAWEPIRPRTCSSKCIFCFIDQLPPGVRPSLRIKDEDYRHSFLYGNFITLGNFSDKDLNRVLERIDFSKSSAPWWKGALPFILKWFCVQGSTTERS